MIIKDSLHNKVLSEEDLNYRVNSWSIYGEESLILFYQHFSITAENLNKLLEYSALADKLVLALPKSTSGDKLFEFANLQVVDAIVLYEDPSKLVSALTNARFAFEDVMEPEIAADDKKRILSL